MRLYTKQGDKGSTRLGDGSVVQKDCIRVVAYGTVDELNSYLGVIKSGMSDDSGAYKLLHEVQHQLFDLGAYLCIGTTTIDFNDVIKWMEQIIDKYTSMVPVLKSFILPAGNEISSKCHYARSLCRRAERDVWSLHADTPVDTACMIYLNRLSDMLFSMARYLGQDEEVLWEKERLLPDV